MANPKDSLKKGAAQYSGSPPPVTVKSNPGNKITDDRSVGTKVMDAGLAAKKSIQKAGRQAYHALRGTKPPLKKAGGED